MLNIGFIKSDKENEKRIALLPKDLEKIINKENIYFEKGYGADLGINDNEYKKYGCKICEKDFLLSDKIQILCDPKIGDSNYLKNVSKGKIIFGWIHAVQNKDITDKLISKDITAYAWEDMFEEGRHVFWKNNEIAGEAATMHALLCYGSLPFDLNVAIIGNGNTSRGAFRVFTQLGARVDIYTRKMEKLFRKELNNYDIIVNTVLWDTSRQDHIIYKNDLANMKPNSLIIDISCDREGAIETSVPTTLDNPTYFVSGIMHYVVDHTPTLLYKTVSNEISKEVSKYIDLLIEEKTNHVLNNALIIKKGKIIDERINQYQGRN